jgi:hypothetical protein
MILNIEKDLNEEYLEILKALNNTPLHAFADNLPDQYTG